MLNAINRMKSRDNIPPTNDLTTMTNLDPPTLTRDQINCQIRKLKEASPDQSINGMQGWMLSFEEIDSLIKWAADMELVACCEWLEDLDLNIDTYKLRSARRPQPPTPKEQALRLLETYGASAVKLTSDQCDIIRRALEATPGGPQ
jgi:hypothetical protein